MGWLRVFGNRKAGRDLGEVCLVLPCCIHLSSRLCLFMFRPIE
ncbi:hypothetical protein FFLO_03164 [Filobasidium floriforme]|uniref:Uncharacterized protein n=1 Tax=Filobasidium floriforme TaxID=5210 RepID=A0A8K0JNA0_9TREE|nr:hypothetical protein FFLO_03164 [Filobasidium floriforme]